MKSNFILGYFFIFLLIVYSNNILGKNFLVGITMSPPDSLVKKFFDCGLKNFQYIYEKDKYGNSYYYTDTIESRHKRSDFSLSIFRSSSIGLDAIENNEENDALNRKVTTIKFFNNGIGTILHLDSLGNLVDIANFTNVSDQGLYYSIALHNNGFLKSVKEVNLDTSLCNSFQRMNAFDTIVVDLDDYGGIIEYEYPEGLEDEVNRPFLLDKRRISNGIQIDYDVLGRPIRCSKISSNIYKEYQLQENQGK